jgi:hypothetical protein
MAAKREIDIEDLLIWAYRDQCVDRQVIGFSPKGPNASPASSLAQFMALGCRVDSSGMAARTLGVRLPDDALIVHDAVLALGDMWIEWRDGDEVVVRDRAGVAGSTFHETARGWVMTDASGARVPVTRAVTSVTLIMHARAASRPECYPGWRPPAHRMPKDDLEYDRWGRRRKSKRIEGPRAEDVMFARAQYCVWRAGLACLALELADLLADHAVTGPLAAESPWQVSANRVLRAVNLQKSFPDNPLKGPPNICV